MPQQEIIETKTRQEWATIINADWRKSIESIIQTGRDLLQAKQDLPNGQFGEMVKEDLDFGWTAAGRLMRIARHPAIVDCAPAHNLPASWTVLSELTQLSKDDFQWAQHRGLIEKDTTKRAARALTGALNAEPGQAANVVGDEMLPKPSEARDIARETGRFVAASDGNVYSGATEEEGADHKLRQQQTYSVRDAIELLAKTKPAENWLKEAEDWWLHNFNTDNAYDAIAWLEGLIGELEKPSGK